MASARKRHPIDWLQGNSPTVLALGYMQANRTSVVARCARPDLLWYGMILTQRHKDAYIAPMQRKGLSRGQATLSLYLQSSWVHPRRSHGRMRASELRLCPSQTRRVNTALARASARDQGRPREMGRGSATTTTFHTDTQDVRTWAYTLAIRLLTRVHQVTVSISCCRTIFLPALGHGTARVRLTLVQDAFCLRLVVFTTART